MQNKSYNPLLNDVNGNIEFIHPNFFEVSKKNGQFGEYEFPNQSKNVIQNHKSALISHFVHIPCVISQVRQNNDLVNVPSYSPKSTLSFSSIPYIDFGDDTEEQISALAKESMTEKSFNTQTNKFYNKYICENTQTGLKPRTIEAYTFYNFFYPMGKASAGSDMTEYSSDVLKLIPILEESERVLLNDPNFASFSKTQLNPQITNDLHTKSFFRSTEEYNKKNSLKEMVKMSFGDMTIKMRDGTIKKAKAKDNLFFVPVMYTEAVSTNNQRLYIEPTVMEVYNKHIGNYGSLDLDLITTVNTITGMEGESQAMLKELLASSDQGMIKDILQELKNKKEAKKISENEK